MRRAIAHPLFLSACCLAAAAAFAQVDYSKEKQRNPTGDPQVEKGYQDTKREIEDRRQKADPPPKESTGTAKGQGETYGKDWQEKQLGTQGKTRTW